MKSRLLRRLVALALGISSVFLTTTLSARVPAKALATIEFIDVGQGDAILITSPEGKTALIDAGPSNGVVTSLKEMGVESIDLVAVSHHHSDHYGGMREVVKKFHPTYFLATNSKHTTSMYLKLLTQVKEQGVKAIGPLSKPRRIELGSVVLTIFPQPPLNDEEENDNSIGLRVTYGSVSVILSGDSEEDERAWWKKHNPELLRDATILKLAHHGSRNGTDAEWLDLIQPELAVASLATGNSYGHPHSEALAVLKQKGVPLKRTDREGTIRIRTDGRRWSVSRSEIASRPTESDSKKTSTRRR